MGQEILIPKRFVVITADSIVDTGRISFKFIFDSNVDYNKHREISNGKWGQLIDLPGCSHAEPSVCINVFDDKPSSGPCFSWGNDSMEPVWAKMLITELSSCTLLMKKEYAEIFKAACDELKIEYHYHIFKGEIKTA